MYRERSDSPLEVAKRVADERGVTLGEEVGYAIRFEDITDKEKTKIKCARGPRGRQFWVLNLLRESWSSVLVPFDLF